LLDATFTDLVSPTSKDICESSELKNYQTLDVTINYSEMNNKSQTDNVCAPSGFVQLKLDGMKKKRKLEKSKKVIPLLPTLKLDRSFDYDLA
jgi:hypothetical protein